MQKGLIGLLQFLSAQMPPTLAVESGMHEFHLLAAGHFGRLRTVGRLWQLSLLIGYYRLLGGSGANFVKALAYTGNKNTPIGSRHEFSSSVSAKVFGITENAPEPNMVSLYKSNSAVSYLFTNLVLAVLRFRGDLVEDANWFSTETPSYLCTHTSVTRLKTSPMQSLALLPSLQQGVNQIITYYDQIIPVHSAEDSGHYESLLCIIKSYASGYDR